jgi:hypothetical protein
MGDRLVLIAYLLGPVALVAALIDDGQDSERTFHLRQALALNLVIGAVCAIFYGVWAPGYLVQAGTSMATLAILAGPLAVILAGLAWLGWHAWTGDGRRLPLLAGVIELTMGEPA